MRLHTVHRRQQGLVLVIALIMLLAVTLMVVTASNLVQANLKVVQNTESRELARAAALAALEEAASDRRFATTPTAIFGANSAGCVNVQGAGNNIVGQCVSDYNGDGQNDVTVSIERPTCVAVTPRANDDFNFFTADAAIQECYRKGLVYSRCGDAVWEFRATARDDATGATVSVRQGISILTRINDLGTGIGSKCPI